jgi:hypothetical protein
MVRFCHAWASTRHGRFPEIPESRWRQAPRLHVRLWSRARERRSVPPPGTAGRRVIHTHVPAPRAPHCQHREPAVCAKLPPLQVEEMVEARTTHSLRRSAAELVSHRSRSADRAPECSWHRQDIVPAAGAAFAASCRGRHYFDHPFQPRLGAPHAAPGAAVNAAPVPVMTARPGKIDQWPTRCSSTRRTRRRLGWSSCAAIASRNSISSRPRADS